MRSMFACVLVLLLAFSRTDAQNMPDPKAIAGIPLPVGDVPVGTVTVRVIRGQMSHNIADQPVDLIVGGVARTVKTDAAGRAAFPGLQPGTRVQARATVAGEPLESREFDVPASGGLRVMLVATDPDTEARGAEDRKLAQAPAQSGIVVLGEQSRFVFELGDDALSVFNILQIVNTARTPVQPPSPVVFELPDTARGVTVLQGSSPQTTAAGVRVSVAGPFAPGTTLVQFAYGVPYSGGELTIQQRLPVALTQLAVMAQKVGDMHLASPQMAQHRDMTADGQIYIVGQGPAVKAGEVVTFHFSHLPHHPAWPRNLALLLAGLVLAGGAWTSIRTGRPSARGQSRRQALQARRDRLFDELTALEVQYRGGAIEQGRYAARRRDLIAALEGVYAELDAETAA
ncbi:MAG: carboxypeptidase-like regulatory domain-containing protein [Acidobacteria bacterium]|nr:carboxypeptidase-like regulatory domain-containing protein [Acidobacteriota bacterium]MCA1651291.1 carboxypeptidase-like regulatory domain-containing protein [Acidobacteriota bacterium]